MKYVFLSLLLGIMLIACNTPYNPRIINNVHITHFTIDSSNIRAIKAIDENTLYFADAKGNIGKTIDSGKTWEVTPVKHNEKTTPNFRSIAVVKDTVFVLSIGNPGLLFKVFKNQVNLVYKEEHPNVFYDALQFFSDGKHGIAVGDPTEDCPSILLTSDYGNSWYKIPCDQLPKFGEGEAFFAASNTNIKIIDETVWMVSGGTKARVLKSKDKGRTWEIYETPIIQGKGAEGMYSVDFYNELYGITIGGDYAYPERNQANKAITKDGGKTWTLVAKNKAPGYKSCIQFVPNTDGVEIFAVGKTGISYSNDGGLTWKQVSDSSFYTIQFINENIAWLGGNNCIGKLIIK
ncbi:oxidoreductase [Tenacibaculum sp. SG-28]|uniref:WD40/YVTN/BNR-like repeat-containing protein n=1 Tax=Tenacibaculum sp. SG-28 TaxID=754426 RepID=UPI000CF4DD56|nr:oxidoreductase [Tenacibaculum sp. SG-28]PQJ23017.1 oxidoreductase [Tenacibaculum sp. SG-28]